MTANSDCDRKLLKKLKVLDCIYKPFEKEYILKILKMTGGNVSQAARLAKRNRTEFYKLLHRHDLDPSSFKPSAAAS